MRIFLFHHSPTTPLVYTNERTLSLWKTTMGHCHSEAFDGRALSTLPPTFTHFHPSAFQVAGVAILAQTSLPFVVPCRLSSAPAKVSHESWGTLSSANVCFYFALFIITHVVCRRPRKRDNVKERCCFQFRWKPRSFCCFFQRAFGSRGWRACFWDVVLNGKNDIVPFQTEK